MHPTLSHLAPWFVLALAACAGAPVPDGDGDTDPSDLDSDRVTGPDRDQDGRVDAAAGGDDCRDTDAASFPGAPEVPGDGIDQDCDGADACFTDQDGDGWGVLPLLPGTPTCAAPGIAPRDGDCDDGDATRSPDAVERCDGVDQDCNGAIDDVADPPQHWLDRDGDGFGDEDAVFASCVRPPGYVPAGVDLPDCDDLDARSRPGALEIPGDGKDQDCDGVDDCWPDADSDGYGDETADARPGTTLACIGFGDAPTGDDCDDADDTIRPGAPESCGPIDHDCDGLIGDEDPDVPQAQRVLAWADLDGDGQGDPFTPVYACVPDTDTTAPNADDCNDDLPEVYLGAVERCNGIDDDCDDKVDTADTDTVGLVRYHADRDNDQYGDPHDSRLLCFPATPHIRTNADDCDDTTALRAPGNTEVAGNVLDEDCDLHLRCFVDRDGDGAAGFDKAELPVATTSSCEIPGYGRTFADCDDSDADVQLLTFWRDVDNDTWGDATSSIKACTAPNQYAARPGDCNDFVPTVHPEAAEVPGNLRDDNCDTREHCFVDRDDDGAGGTDTDLAIGLLCSADGLAYTADDCADTDRSVYPGAPEVVGDGIDQNCDDRDACFLDRDDDGAGIPLVVPSNDLTCDGRFLATTPDDCDDANDAVFPGAPEACNGIDDDCDDRIDDADTDVDEGRLPWWYDGDADGHGDPDDRVLRCVDPGPDRVDNPDDCDDTRARWNTTCPWDHLALGDGFTCGLRTDGDLVCVGTGPGATDAPSGVFTDVAAEGGLACALTDQGVRTCWGQDSDDRLPDTDADADTLAVGPEGVCWSDGATVQCSGDLSGLAPVGGPWTALLSVPGRVCGLDDAGLACDGATLCGDLPDPTEAVDLIGDDTFTCVRTASGRLRCDGCAGPGLDGAPDDPRIGVLDAHVGTGGACAVTGTGIVSCWDALPGIAATPPLDRPGRVRVGTDHACAIDADAVIHCWGTEALARTPPSPASP